MSNMLYPLSLHFAARKIAAGLASVFFPFHQFEIDNGVVEAEKLLDRDVGLIVVMNHFSLRDPLQLTGWLFQNRVFSRRDIVAPVAYHRYEWLLRSLCWLMAIETYPIATPKTIRLRYGISNRNKAMKLYLESAVAALAEGSIVFLAPQAGRRCCLGEPLGHPVGRLFEMAAEKEVHNIGVLLLGFSIPDVVDYGDSSVRGLNPLRRYDVVVSRPYLFDEILQQAGSASSIDSWIFAEMAQLLPPAYQNPSKFTAGDLVFERSAYFND